MNACTLIQAVVVSYTLFQLVSLPLSRRTEAKAAANLSERRPGPPWIMKFEPVWNLVSHYTIWLLGFPGMGNNPQKNG